MSRHLQHKPGTHDIQALLLPELLRDPERSFSAAVQLRELEFHQTAHAGLGDPHTALVRLWPLVSAVCLSWR